MASVFFSSLPECIVRPNRRKCLDDKLGGGNNFSAAEKYKGRIVNIIGLEKHENVNCGLPLLEFVGVQYCTWFRVIVLALGLASNLESVRIPVPSESGVTV